MTPQEAIAAIDNLEKFGINLGLKRIKACLEALGSPQLAYPTVHVAGTNGKGSTSAMLASVLAASGYRVGLYTSPALESFGERMRINGAPMDDAEVPALLDAVLAAASRNPDAEGMTQFEVICAMAFEYFKRQKVDIAVVEVGLGGRLDSTNVLDPLAVAVTSIGLEHSEHLGGTVEKIAREKVGVAKKGIALVTAAADGVLEAVEAEAAKLGARVVAQGREYSVAGDAPPYTYRSGTWSLEGLAPALRGAFQRQNMGVALALADQLRQKGWTIPDEAVRDGLASTSWPGRMEEFAHPDRQQRALIDGAHNPHAALALARALESLYGDRDITLILGILGDKDAYSIISTLAPLAGRVIFTRSTSTRAVVPEALKEKVLSILPAGEIAPGIDRALEMALEMGGEERAGDKAGLIVLTGSLTLAGEARTLLGAKGWSPS